MIKLIKQYKLEILIFLIFVFSRMPDLGHDMFNTDVWKWKARTYDFGTGVFTLDFEKTIQKYHPGVTLMWLGSVGVKINNFYYEKILQTSVPNNDIEVVFLLHKIQKLVIVIFLGLVLAFIFHPLKELFGRKYAVVTMLIFIFEPFYTALTRVMHLEGLMSTLMIASFVWLYYYFRKDKTKYLILSAVFAAAAFLTKTSAVFMVPFSALLIFMENIIDTMDLKKSVVATIKMFFIWFAVALLAFFLIWPALWTNTLEALQTLYRGVFTIGVERGHYQLFMGNWVEDPGWLFYLVVIVYRVSLVLYVGFLAFLFTFHKYIKHKGAVWFVVYTLVFAAFYAIELSIPAKKLDRYILPSIMSLVLMVGFFYEYLIDFLNQKVKYLGFLVILVLLGYYAWTISYLHPNYFAYYSPVFGGLKRGVHAIEPKWMLGQREIANYFDHMQQSKDFNTFKPGESIDEVLYTPEIDDRLTVGFQEKYYTQIWPFIEEIGARATVKDLTPQAVRSKYFVYPVYDNDSTSEDRFELEFVDNIKVNGVDLYAVYRRVEP
jgi:hypothetical protein